MRALCSFGIVGLMSIALSACGGDGGEAGESCDPGSADSCAMDLVCGAGSDGANICLVPAGGTCDPEAEMAYCAQNGICVAETAEDGSTTGTCYLPEGAACDPDNDFCDPALSCALLVDDTYACHRPLVIRGLVRDSADASPIEGAHVISWATTSSSCRQPARWMERP